MTQRTPLYHEHQKLNARIVDFAGFDMPVQYTGVVDEHHAVRKAAGLFDVSHMGEFLFEGPQAESFLEYLTPNNVSKLADGMAQYSMLLLENGGIVDDILVYRYNPKKFVVVVNASNIEKDFAWVRSHKAKFPEVNLTDISDQTALLALQGPKAKDILQTLVDIDLSAVKTFHFFVGTIFDIKNVTVARTGYTGEDGFEIFCGSDRVVALWQALLKASQPFGLKPSGLGARDTLRLEARLSLYGHEINEDTNPLEAGLSWVIKLDKPTDFIGKAALLKIKEAGLKRQIVGFKMIDKGIPRQSCRIRNGQNEIGFVTSGTFSPTLQVGLGLGFVPTDFSAIGTKFNIDIRGNLKLAEVVKTPFYTRR